MSHHDTHAAGEHAHGEHHITPLWLYNTIFGALLFLTVVTVWIAQFDFGAANTVIAMFVATIKASLVALFFMHLLHDERINLLTFGFGLLFVALFFLFPLLDIGTRSYIEPLKDNNSVRAAATEQKKQDKHADTYKDELNKLTRLNATGFIATPEGEGPAAPAPEPAPEAGAEAGAEAPAQ
jgi:caa(3)-type oxidase subunit IV